MGKSGIELWKNFKNKEWIFAEDLPILKNYIYGCFDGGFRSKKMYAYSNYLTKCQIVLDFKRDKGLEQKIKLGEAICSNKLVNFFDDLDHTIAKCNCGSVYWDYYGNQRL